MAAITATNVTYAITKIKKMEDGRKIVNLTIQFGNGTLTYPANGVPLTSAMVGCPNTLDSLDILGQRGALYTSQWDYSHNSIRLFQTGAANSGPLVELTTAATPASETLDCVAIGY